jgi:hypothetical protein
MIMETEDQSQNAFMPSMLGQSLIGMPSVHAQEAIAEQLKYLLENADIMIQIENYLKGFVYDYSTNTFEKKYEAKVNDDGINQIMSRLRPLTEKNIILSHMPSKNANAIVMEFAKNLAIDIVFYSKVWGIKDSDIHTTWEIITNMVYSAYSKGEEGTFLRFLSRTMFMGFQENSGQLRGGMGGAGGGYKAGFFEKINPFATRRQM